MVLVCRAAVAAALIAGCYGPSVAPGAPCSEDGSCPGGQECRADICYPLGAPHDSGEDIDGELDAPMIDAPPDGPPYFAWGTATELTSLESAGSGETDPSLSSDRLTAVIVADMPAGDAQIYIATRAALTDTFTVSELTAINAVGFNESSPELSADGKTLYFISNRSGAYEVYISTFTTVWSTPTIRTDLSTANYDDDLAISPDGLTAVVIGGGAHFRFHTRANTADAFGTAVVHSELETQTNGTAPTITNGGEVIYFHANSPRQLYWATKKLDGTYTTPAPVNELNVAGVRFAAPFVAQSNEYMIFERAGNIYETTRDLP
jgi:hypothetical protein